MADVRASVARMCNVCPVRRRLYFYARSIHQAARQHIRRKRDRVSAIGRMSVVDQSRSLRQHADRLRQHFAH